LFRVVVVQTRRGQVSSAVSPLEVRAKPRGDAK
jgi:hypothetical protein